jgi:hypothetical protein
MVTLALDGAFYVLTAHKPAHGHGHDHDHGGKVEKNNFWRKLRHKGGCCFGWAVYAPWACYMAQWTLCVSKVAKCPLVCLDDLAGDRILYVLVNRGWTVFVRFC